MFLNRKQGVDESGLYTNPLLCSVKFSHPKHMKQALCEHHDTVRISDVSAALCLKRQE